MVYKPFRRALEGAAAGAVGTVALNIATYADMAVRGRPSSDVPAKVVGAIAGTLGVGTSTAMDEADQQQAESRKSGTGALLGYATGLSIGTAYGLIRSMQRPQKPAAPLTLLVGVALGMAAMVGSDAPATVTGATDPRTWGVSGWLADLLPHLAYGVVTALTFETLTSQ